MSGLVLKLAPKERVLINGVVVENGLRSARISIRTSNANILRLKDAIPPDQAKTPVARACFAAQLILSGDVESQVGFRDLQDRVSELTGAFQDSASRDVLAAVRQATDEHNAYAALRLLRQLLPLESRLLGREMS